MISKKAGMIALCRNGCTCCLHPLHEMYFYCVLQNIEGCSLFHLLMCLHKKIIFNVALFLYKFKLLYTERYVISQVLVFVCSSNH